MSFSRELRVFCWLVTAFSMVVMGAWLFDWQFNFIQFNNACSLLFAAQALRGLVLGNRKWLVIFAGLLCIFSGAIFFQYIIDINFGVDSLFTHTYLDLNSRPWGRMGAGASVCFLLLGCSLMFNLHKGLVTIIGLSTSILVAWIAFLSLLSYIFNINTDFAWGIATRLDGYTAFFITLLGLAIPLVFYGDKENKGPRFVTSFVATLMLISVTVGITQVLAQSELNKAKNFFEYKAMSMANEIQDNFYARHLAFERMSFRWENDGYHGKKEWLEDAANYYKDFKGIQSLYWISPDNFVRYVYPLDGNQIMENRDLSHRPTAMENLRQAKFSKKVYVTPARDASMGGDGFGVLYPMYSNKSGKYEGVIGVTYRFQNMFQNLLRSDDFRMEIYEKDNLLYRENFTENILNVKWRFSHTFDLLNRQWTLVISPTISLLEQQSTFIPLMILFFGLVISTLFNFAIMLYFNALDAKRSATIVSEWQRAVTESSHFMIISTDERGLVRSYNRAAENLLEYTVEEVIGKMSPKVWHDPQEVAGFETLVASARRGIVDNREYTYISKNGKKFKGALTVSPIRDELKNITGFVGIVEDVTNKKNQEAKMITSSRLASLGEMAAGIAHEINNPLTIIVAQAANVRKNIQGKLGVEEGSILIRLEKIEQTAQRIAKIIRGLKVFAREDGTKEKQLSSVSEIIDETLSFCSERFRNAGVDLQIQVRENLQFYGHPWQISQVILNLLNNAFDAVKNEKQSVVRIAAMQVKSGIEISVEDSGPGVPSELQPKIMQPFFTTKEVGDGLGLGLSISQGIAEAHEGRLYLDNLSVRTRFVLWLPTV